MFRNDLSHTGRSLYEGPTLGVFLWSYVTGAGVESSPVVDNEGRVYAGASSGDNNVYALNSDGTLSWSYATGSGVDASFSC